MSRRPPRECADAARLCVRIRRALDGVAFATLLVAPVVEAQRSGKPIIDVHLHAYAGRVESPAYRVTPGESPDVARLRAVVAEMDANNVVLGIMGGIARYSRLAGQAYPARFIVGVSFPCTDGLDPNLVQCFDDGSDWPKVDWLRAEIEAGKIGALGELFGVYYGLSPQDSAWIPYYALAAVLDIPVIVHVGAGPPPQMRTPGCCPNFKGEYGDPLLLEPVLKRFPNLRLILVHAFDAPPSIELMRRYSNVYVETSPMDRVPQFFVHQALRAYKAAGLMDRVVFGSDYFGAMAKSIGVIEAADFLTEEDKRAIFYNNAARLLELTPEHIRQHHSR